MHWVTMANRKIDDQRPGKIPIIRCDDEAITFEFECTTPEIGGHLVIRCDTKGQVWARIARAGGNSRSGS